MPACPCVCCAAPHRGLPRVTPLPRRLQGVIKAVNSNKKSTWIAGHNDKFAGMTVAQASRLMGTLREGPHATRAAMKADAYPALPVNVKAM